MMSDINKTDRISFRPEPGDKDALVALAARLEKSPSDLLRGVLRAFLRRELRKSSAA